jgi:anti-anti-sigma factor
MTMALEITVVVSVPVAEISLSGYLDAAVAPRFQQELETALANKPSQLVLRVRELVYMASIGIRVMLKVLKQNPGLAVYVIAPQELVLQTLERTGMHQSLMIQDEYPAPG